MSPVKEDLAPGDSVQLVGMPDESKNGLTGTVTKALGKDKFTVQLEGHDKTTILRADNLQKRSLPSSTVSTCDDGEQHENEAKEQAELEEEAAPARGPAEAPPAAAEAPAAQAMAAADAIEAPPTAAGAAASPVEAPAADGPGGPAAGDGAPPQADAHSRERGGAGAEQAGGSAPPGQDSALPDQKSNTIKLHVRQVSGKPVLRGAEVGRADTVLSVKQLTEAALKEPVVALITRRGALLDDSLTLEAAGVRDMEVVQAMVSVPEPWEIHLEGGVHCFLNTRTQRTAMTYIEVQKELRAMAKSQEQPSKADPSAEPPPAGPASEPPPRADPQEQPQKAQPQEQPSKADPAAEPPPRADPQEQPQKAEPQELPARPAAGPAEQPHEAHPPRQEEERPRASPATSPREQPCPAAEAQEEATPRARTAAEARPSRSLALAKARLEARAEEDTEQQEGRQKDEGAASPDGAHDDGSGGVRIYEAVATALVRKGRDPVSEKFEDRLEKGALVVEEESDNGRIRYRKIQGTGPDAGWVAIKIQSKVLLELKTGEERARAMAQAIDASRTKAKEQRKAMEKEEADYQRRSDLNGVRMKGNPSAKSAEQLKEEDDERRVLEREREARERLVRRLEEAAKHEMLAIKEKEEDRGGASRRDWAPELVDFTANEKDRPVKVFKYRWGEKLAPTSEDWGPIMRGSVQAAWVWEGKLYVVKNGLLAETRFGRRWDGSLRRLERLLQGFVQAAWVWEGVLYIVREGRVAITEFGARWNGLLEDWGRIFHGRVDAAWVSDGKLYVVKEGGKVAITEWGEPWNGQTEEWSEIGTGPCKAAWVHEGFLYVVKPSD